MDIGQNIGIYYRPKYHLLAEMKISVLVVDMYLQINWYWYRQKYQLGEYISVSAGPGPTQP
jgi:hypothetical protein